MKRRVIEWVDDDDGISRIRVYEDESPETLRFSRLTLKAELTLHGARDIQRFSERLISLMNEAKPMEPAH